jgi:plastocyanin
LEENSSGDEDDPLVPRDWDSYNFSQLSVNPGENVSWEYRDNTVSVGPRLLCRESPG